MYINKANKGIETLKLSTPSKVFQNLEGFIPNENKWDVIFPARLFKIL